MEFVLVLVAFLVLALIAGGAILVYLELKKSNGLTAGPPVSIEGLKTELDARYQTEIERLRSEARGAVGEIEAELGRLREGLRTSAHEHDTQLARMRDRFVEVDGQTAKAVEHSLGELRVHQEAELTRLRDAVGAAMAALAVRSAGNSDAVAGRKAEAISGLYRRLAKLETDFLAVTNPVLLPGEKFSLPADLLPETLKWESWKDVGDAVFSFADAFNQERIFLDDESCRELTGFVSDLREVMTTAIYPNLMPRPGVPLEESRQELRRGIEQLGHEIPDARERLERAFRDGL